MSPHQGTAAGGGPDVKRTSEGNGNGEAHASAELKLHVATVSSPGSLALVQIGCGLGNAMRNLSATPRSGSPDAGAARSTAGGDGGGVVAAAAVESPPSCARQAVDMLARVGGVLRERCSEAGVDGGTLWNVRLFVVAELAAEARAVIAAAEAEGASRDGEAPEVDLGMSGLVGGRGDCGSGDFGHGRAGSASDAWAWTRGLALTEVSGLGDEDGSLVWAVRALYVRV